MYANFQTIIRYSAGFYHYYKNWVISNHCESQHQHITQFQAYCVQYSYSYLVTNNIKLRRALSSFKIFGAQITTELYFGQVRSIDLLKLLHISMNYK